MSMGAKRWTIGLLAGVLLVAFFMVQRASVAQTLGFTDKSVVFVFDKTFRFVVNDLLMVGIIYSLYGQRRYVYFALWVQLVGIIFILIPYLIIKLYFEAGNGPMVSFLHRLIINPTLMILLIPAFWLQSRKHQSSTKH